VLIRSTHLLTQLLYLWQYLGGHPGQATNKCRVFDHSKAPGKGQWSSFPDLPGPRGGGGMVYDSVRNSLVFAAGATRPVVGSANTIDHPTTWTISLSEPGAQWVQKADIPFTANHMAFTSAKDSSGSQHLYFMGGQTSEQEANGNNQLLYEWVSSSESWVRRQDMLKSRGHASSSTKGYGCGFFTIAGTSNGLGKIPDIDYYDSGSNSWTKIGDLGNSLNTPVCDAVTLDDGDWLYCVSPGSLAKKRKIGV
jgi:hypothetical protein